jgi:reductive dehalogenase
MPEYGTAGRIYNVATDLPLAPTHPIDAGMYRFCHTCHKCADACPAGVISQESESTFEPDQVEGKDPIFHRLGPKALWNNFSGCRIFIQESGGCNRCWGECTFAMNSGAMAHEMARATVSTTSLFNGFLWRMGEIFGYKTENEKAEEWWNLNLPIYGIDSTRPSTDGGYRK